MDMERPNPGESFFVNVDVRIAGKLESETMPTTFIQDGLWRRETGEHCYNLRRIVDEEGHRLPVYDYFVQKVLEKNRDGGSKNPDKVLQVRLVKYNAFSKKVFLCVCTTLWAWSVL